jgi:hypothetical protein
MKHFNNVLYQLMMQGLVLQYIINSSHFDRCITLASRRSKPPDVDVFPHTVFIRSSVLRCKPINLLPLGFETQTKKLS